MIAPAHTPSQSTILRGRVITFARIAAPVTCLLVWLGSYLGGVNATYTWMQTKTFPQGVQPVRVQATLRVNQGRVTLSKDVPYLPAPVQPERIQESTSLGWSTVSWFAPFQFDPPTDWFYWQPGAIKAFGLSWTRMATNGLSITFVHIPFWLITAAAAMPLLLHFTLPSRTRKRRRARGLCEHCGYSRVTLSAITPCPECGSVPTSA